MNLRLVHASNATACSCCLCIEHCLDLFLLPLSSTLFTVLTFLVFRRVASVLLEKSHSSLLDFVIVVIYFIVSEIGSFNQLFDIKNLALFDLAFIH